MIGAGKRWSTEGADTPREALMTPVSVKQVQRPQGMTWAGRRVTYLYPIGGGDVTGKGVPARALDPDVTTGGGDHQAPVRE